MSCRFVSDAGRKLVSDLTESSEIPARMAPRNGIQGYGEADGPKIE
jgi:hypothetical protein